MKEFWGIPLIIWLIVCLLIAVIYLFVPKKMAVKEISTFQRLILKYGHSVVWLLLALSCLLSIYNLNGFAKTVSLWALIVYIIFILNFLKYRIKADPKNNKLKKRTSK